MRLRYEADARKAAAPAATSGAVPGSGRGRRLMADAQDLDQPAAASLSQGPATMDPMPPPARRSGQAEPEVRSA